MFVSGLSLARPTCLRKKQGLSQENIKIIKKLVSQKLPYFGDFFEPIITPTDKR
jgi:hypothetical protein